MCHKACSLQEDLSNGCGSGRVHGHARAEGWLRLSEPLQEDNGGSINSCGKLERVALIAVCQTGVISGGDSNF
jgi:hypothetical protein